LNGLLVVGWEGRGKVEWLLLGKGLVSQWWARKHSISCFGEILEIGVLFCGGNFVI
jgi:hypothetical protein